MKKIIIMSMGSGKTTLSKRGRIFSSSQNCGYDVDEAKDPQFEDELKILRRARDWKAHNAIWHPMMRKWANGKEDGSLLFVHSPGDALAINLPEDRIFRTEVPIRDIVIRVMRRDPGDTETLRLAVLNWSGNHEHPLWNTFPEWFIPNEGE